MLFPNELIALHEEREKLILDTWLNTKGFNIEVKPVLISDGTELVEHDLDPFDIDINRIGYDQGSVSEFGDIYEQRAVLINEQFQFHDISYSILVEEISDLNNSSNMGEVYCFIGGDIVPKYSIVTLYKDEVEPYPNDGSYPTSVLPSIGISFRVEEVAKKRPLSNIYRYKLVRY